MPDIERRGSEPPNRGRRDLLVYLGWVAAATAGTGVLFKALDAQYHWVNLPQATAREAAARCLEIENQAGDLAITLEALTDYKDTLAQMWTDYYPTNMTPRNLSGLLTVINSTQDPGYWASVKASFLVREDVNTLNLLGQVFRDFEQTNQKSPIYLAKDQILKTYLSGSIDQSRVLIENQDVVTVLKKIKDPSIPRNRSLIISTPGLRVQIEQEPTRFNTSIIPVTFAGIRELTEGYLLAAPNQEYNLPYLYNPGLIGDLKKFKGLLAVNSVSPVELFAFYRDSDLSGICQRLSKGSERLASWTRQEQIDFWIKNLAFKVKDDRWEEVGSFFPQM